MFELKPCPFCGGEARTPFYYDPFDGYKGNLGRYRVRCSKCSAEIEERTMQEAIEAWNRRAEDGKCAHTDKTGLDAVEVVRCKDCRYFSRDNMCNRAWCNYFAVQIETAVNGYCYHSAKMDGGNEDV